MIRNLLFLLACSCFALSATAREPLSKKQVLYNLKNCIELGEAEEEGCFFRNIESFSMGMEEIPENPEIKIIEGYFSNPTQLEALAIVGYKTSDWMFWDVPNALAVSYIYNEEQDEWVNIAIEPFFLEARAENITGGEVSELRVHLERCHLGECRWYDAVFTFRDQELSPIYERYDYSREMLVRNNGNLVTEFLVEGDTVNHRTEVRFEDLDGDGINELIEHHELDLYLPDPDAEGGFDKELEIVDRFYRLEKGRYVMYEEVAD